MQTRIFWIIEEGDGTLGIMARPSGGELLAGEIRALQEMGVSVVVSLLTEEERGELDLTKEPELCEQCGMEFISFPIKDRQLPLNMHLFLQFVQSLSESLNKGGKIIVHCRIGIGRAALVTAAVLVKQGISADQAFARISMSRGCTVPDTEEQLQWLRNFAQQHCDIESIGRLFDG